MKLNSELFKRRWFSNGKQCTTMSYVYIVCGIVSLTTDPALAMTFAIMAELSKVDKELRFLSVTQAQEIIDYNDAEDDTDGQ